MLGHKESLNTIKEIKTISSIFSDHNKMKLEINYRKSGKITYMWRLNNMQLKNYWLNEEIKGENLKYLKTNEKKKDDTPKSMGCSKSGPKSEAYRPTSWNKKNLK